MAVLNTLFGVVRECVFCQIVAGSSPATIRHEWHDAIVFDARDGVTAKHVLVVPKIHVRDALEDAEVTAMTMRRAVHFAKSYGECNILTSVGAAATQSVFHLHIHVVARGPGDELMVPWGTTGDPHAPHWCATAQGLQDRLDGLTRPV